MFTYLCMLSVRVCQAHLVYIYVYSYLVYVALSVSGKNKYSYFVTQRLQSVGNHFSSFYFIFIFHNSVDT